MATIILGWKCEWPGRTHQKLLRVGETIEFFEIIFKFVFKFVCFFKEKSCHSNSTTTFILDHVKPNGFQYRVDQARNCPFRLSDDRWRHVRLRNRLLYNLKKWKSFNPISEKGMNCELIKLALKSSYIRFLVNRQSFVSTFIPW